MTTGAVIPLNLFFLFYQWIYEHPNGTRKRERERMCGTGKAGPQAMCVCVLCSVVTRM